MTSSPRSLQPRLTIDDIQSMVSEREFLELASIYQSLFNIEYSDSDLLAKHVKCRIVGPRFIFMPGLSAASRTFMLTHTIGHFFFICQAERRRVTRYKHIYDSFAGTTLNVYDRAQDIESGMEIPLEVVRDRVAFEKGANRYSLDLLDEVGWPHVKPIIAAYEAADIHYVLDIMRRGESAVLSSDVQHIRNYVCAELPALPEVDDKDVWEPGGFAVGSLDWSILENLNFESYFF